MTKFPSINSEIAFYSPSNFKITLCKLSSSEFLRLNDNIKDLDYAKHKSIILHETRHYVDHISTLWGKKHILKHAQAIDIRLNLDHLKYQKIVEYSLESKRLFYKDYYSEVYTNDKFELGEKPWISKIVMAHKFDNDGNSDPKSPIILFRFFKNNVVKTPVARVPLSIVSLLETNSTFEEIRIRALSIGLQDEDTKLIEHFNFNKNLICDLIYNQNLAVYNVAAHLTANILNIQDIAKAIETSSTFATIALNMPSKLIQKMYINQHLYKSWINEIPFLINNFDYGFIFMNLLFNYKEKYNGDAIDISEILESSKLGDYDSFEKLVLEEMDCIYAEIEKQENFKNIFIEELSRGKKIFSSLGIGFEKNNISQVLHTNKIYPHYEFSDTPLNIVGYNKNKIYGETPHTYVEFNEWIEYSAFIEDEINNFFEIRGI